ncbi:MAG TPA: hypothetical protein VFG81_18705 [Anaerolineales bacterium]|nr:hypothetical protein [Anaerolineales bacterium]
MQVVALDGRRLVAFNIQPREETHRGAPEPEREDDPVRDHCRPLHELCVGEILNQDHKARRCRNLPQSVLHRRQVDRKRRQSPALALRRKFCHAIGVSTE